MLGEGGIIQKAEQAKQMQANATKAEEEAMDSLLDQVVGMLDDVVTGPKLDTTTADGKTAMTPVKWNGSNWVATTEEDDEWYNYRNKQWANVVLGDATWNSDGTLDESKAYSQLVWIPRFAYKITSLYHTASTSAGNIDVVFIDTNNKDKNGTEYTRDTAAEYPTSTVGGGMSDYVVHPAFDYGGTKLAGFWVGKFESSHTNCTTTASTGQATYTGSEVMTIKANVTSWRNITNANIFATCLAMNASGNPYGLSSDDTVVDPHMMKNSEWGAVAYLSQSRYGKNSEVYKNNSSTYITGNAGSTAKASSVSGVTNAYNTANGMKASTTGNITGVYDMSGGAYERVAAYVNNSHDNLTANGGDLTANGTASKYRDVYSASATDGTSDTQADNYALSTPANGHYGDAAYETSGYYAYTNSWYSNCSRFPYGETVFFYRNGTMNSTNPLSNGVFYFEGARGAAAYAGGFRVVVPVL